MSETGAVAPKYGVLKRSNGHAEITTGPIIRLFDTEDEANAEADALMAKHHGIVFAVFKILSQRSVVPTPKVETLSEEKS